MLVASTLERSVNAFDTRPTAQGGTMMKKATMALATGLLTLTLAAPAGAAVRSLNGRSEVSRYQDRRPERCHTDHRGGERRDRGDCYDERRPQHDGDGSILF
jgi:hypothetical protein